MKKANQCVYFFFSLSLGPNGKSTCSIGRDWTSKISHLDKANNSVAVIYHIKVLWEVAKFQTQKLVPPLLIPPWSIYRCMSGRLDGQRSRKKRGRDVMVKKKNIYLYRIQDLASPLPPPHSSGSNFPHRRVQQSSIKDRESFVRLNQDFVT